MNCKNKHLFLYYTIFLKKSYIFLKKTDFIFTLLKFINYRNKRKIAPKTIK